MTKPTGTHHRPAPRPPGNGHHHRRHARDRPCGAARASLQLRHTDRRPTVDVPVSADQIDQLRHIADSVGVHLHKLSPDQVTD